MQLSRLLLRAVGGSNGIGNTDDTNATHDTVAPSISIKWANPARIVQNTPYIDAGATAVDDVDEAVVVTSIDDVNTSIPGEYSVSYAAKDTAGNSATASRSVVVVEDVDITHNGTEYSIVASPYTGKIWLDRNLGATQVCTSFDDVLCYGDYYQWGRNYDGHQEKNSETTETQATDINNTSSRFITGPADWASTDSSGDERSSNWSKTDGTSVCPLDFRVPTLAEFKAELFDEKTLKIENREDAFKSFLSLPSAGLRVGSGGNMRHVGVTGYLRTLSAGSLKVSGFLFGKTGVEASKDANNLRAVALSVRCIKK